MYPGEVLDDSRRHCSPRANPASWERAGRRRPSTAEDTLLLALRTSTLGVFADEPATAPYNEKHSYLSYTLAVYTPYRPGLYPILYLPKTERSRNNFCPDSWARVCGCARPKRRRSFRLCAGYEVGYDFTPDS